MFQYSRSQGLVSKVGKIKRSDRWIIYHRLQELEIPCWCAADGILWVEINNAIDAVLLRSTVQSFIACRQELIHWLDRCWDAKQKTFQ